MNVASINQNNVGICFNACAAFSPPKPPPMMTTRVFLAWSAVERMLTSVRLKCERPMNAGFTRFVVHAGGRDHCSARRVQGLPVASHSLRRQRLRRGRESVRDVAGRSGVG